MNVRQRRAISLTVAGLILVGATLANFAQGRPAIKSTLSGSVERGQNGEAREIPLDQSGPVRPGETLRWSLASTNGGSAPVRHLTSVGQVPKGTVFIADSASGEANPAVSYSLDGGRSYSARPVIEEKQPDGGVKLAPAPVSLYTHVRFEWREPLGVGASRTAHYRTRVK
jgi:uncharacterized repeat protein (TIGR01451 family)